MMKMVLGDNKIDNYDLELVEHLLELFVDKCMGYGLKAQEKDSDSLSARISELESTVCQMEYNHQHLQSVSEDLVRRMGKVEFQIKRVETRNYNFEEKRPLFARIKFSKSIYSLFIVLNLT